ncbi:hypothetical protein ACHAXA_002731, partial [Cyclostephanos tholiformis]
ALALGLVVEYKWLASAPSIFRASSFGRFGSSRIAKPAYPVWPTSKLHSTPGYPEGNFGGNQLLDGLISLLPLYPNLMIDLHVRITTSLHQSFPWLCPTQA